MTDTTITPKKNKKWDIHLNYPIISLLILILFSVVAIISGVGMYKISVEGSKNLLETRAVDIAVNLNFTLERLGLNKDLFPGLMRSSRWDDLAFLALYDESGRVLLHSNPHLVGRDLKDPFAGAVIRQEKVDIRLSRLATGEEVFILDFPLQIHNEKVEDDSLDKVGPDDATEREENDVTTYCLRIALHTYPARSIVRRAHFQLLTIAVSLCVLWLLTFFFLWQWRKNERLKKRLQEQEHMARLGEMAAVLAHEIRNPLSSIKGFAQYHLEGQKDPDLYEDLSLIVKESVRLEHLTESLLAYARPLELHPTSVNLSELCQDIKRAVGPVAEGVTLEFDCCNRTIFIDREKLMQIILNLIQNGIEAVDPQDGVVKVSCLIRDEVLVIIIEDNGPGVSEKINGRIFEPFITTKTKGTGLGLAIVRRLVDAMGGKIGFSRRKEGGTRVLVTFPFREQRTIEHEENFHNP